jgi:hypothetical protein
MIHLGSQPKSVSHVNRAWDTNLLASLGGSDDMVAMDEKDHLKCLVNL